MREAVVALIYRGDKILAVSRKNDPNDFGLIGGSIEEGEERVDALRREIKEETNLDLLKEKHIFTRTDNDFICYTYLCEVEGDVKTTETGVVKEVSWSELFKGSFGEYNRNLFNVINNG